MPWYRHDASAGLPITHSPILAGLSLVFRTDISTGQLSMRGFCPKGSSVSGRGNNLSPPTKIWRGSTLGVDLSTEVVETILSIRA